MLRREVIRLEVIVGTRERKERSILLGGSPELHQIRMKDAGGVMELSRGRLGVTL